MGIVDHESKIRVAYSQADVYSALKICISNIEGFSIDHTDDRLTTIHIKTNVSLFSWGENISVSVSSSQDGSSKITVLSTPKTGMMFGGAMDMGKNRKNINLVMDALSEQLKSYTPIDNEKKPQIDLADQIRKLADLKDSGILTESEFEQKKKQLLNL